MTLKELCEAILVAEDDIVIDNNIRLLRKETLLEICGSLIRYDLVTTRVTLAHSSVFEFLTSQAIKASDMRTYYLDRLTAQSSVTRRCIGYMCLPAFSSGCCPTHDALVQRVQDWPLLTYIAKTLFAHLHYTDLNDDMRSILLRFFATHHLPRGGNFGAWVQVFMPDVRDNIEESTPLYYAARFGLVHIVRLILNTEERSSLELRGGRQMSTPLQVASWVGRTEVVRELLKAGASINETNKYGETSLMWAVAYGYSEIEQLLRNAGATLNDYQTELSPSLNNVA